MVGSLRSNRALAAICVFTFAVGIANVARYPQGKGYDAGAHMAYADSLVPGGHLPHGVGEYYTPPGYYAVAGAADWVARKVGVSFYGGYRAGMAVNVFFLLGTVLLVWKLARELWPGRDRIAIGAAAFVALVPVTVKTEAMFHPETLSLFTCTLALWLCVRTFADRRYAYALGVALGLAQLVRAFSLWTVARSRSRSSGALAQPRSWCSPRSCRRRVFHQGAHGSLFGSTGRRVAVVVERDGSASTSTRAARRVTTLHGRTS